MAGFIARQPNGLLCRHSTIVDCVTDYNMTEEDYINLCIEKARKEAKEVLEKYIQPFDMVECFLQALFPQKCRLNSSKLHGEFPHYCISSAGTLSGAGEEPLQAYKVY